MEQTLVSVVIPVYNVEPWLDRCIRSAAGQTHTNLDIILVDDGSTDGSPAICDSWAARDSRIRVCRKKNAGAGFSRNAGLDLARGEYIFFFDSDDYVAPHTVEVCLAKATAHSADVVLYGLNDVHEDGTIYSKPIHPALFTGASITQELLPGLFTYKLGIGISACGKMFRMDAIRAMGLRFRSEREILSEDACFCLEFFLKCRTAVIVPESLYFYCRRSLSLTRTYRPDQQQRNNVFLETTLGLVRKAGAPKAVSDYLKARYQIYALSAMKQTVTADLPAQARRGALKALLRDPVLRTTLEPEVLSLHGKRLRLFYTLLKYRCYPVCAAMLTLKTRT